MAFNAPSSRGMCWEVLPNHQLLRMAAPCHHESLCLRPPCGARRPRVHHPSALPPFLRAALRLQAPLAGLLTTPPCLLSLPAPAGVIEPSEGSDVLDHITNFDFPEQPSDLAAAAAAAGFEGGAEWVVTDSKRLSRLVVLRK